MNEFNLSLLFSKDWSNKVETKWTPPEGFFKQSATKIAKGLKEHSKSKRQAMSRLNFYINRSGKNLSEADRKRLELAKKKLSALYDKNFSLLNSVAFIGKISLAIRNAYKTWTSSFSEDETDNGNWYIDYEATTKSGTEDGKSGPFKSREDAEKFIEYIRSKLSVDERLDIMNIYQKMNFNLLKFFAIDEFKDSAKSKLEKDKETLKIAKEKVRAKHDKIKEIRDKAKERDDKEKAKDDQRLDNMQRKIDKAQEFYDKQKATQQNMKNNRGFSAKKEPLSIDYDGVTLYAYPAKFLKLKSNINDGKLYLVWSIYKDYKVFFGGWVLHKDNLSEIKSNEVFKDFIKAYKLLDSIKLEENLSHIIIGKFRGDIKVFQFIKGKYKSSLNKNIYKLNGDKLELSK